MQHRSLLSYGVAGILATSAICNAAVAADPNPAMNAPDALSWKFFVDVTMPAATAGNNNVVFETWASNDDTFRLTPPPAFPATPSPKILAVSALKLSLPPGLRPHVLPGASQETRRNKVAFDFIVNNGLNRRSGLKAAFAAGKNISFDIDSFEVKADWIPAGPNIDPAQFHINTASDGKQYALVSLHIISKNIPNWTWATFEHQSNAGRCDFTGCRDSFGAVTPLVPAKTPTRGQYPPCVKTAALQKMMADAKLAPAFSSYCLRGSQVDFVTSTGVPTLLGNTVPEDGFVNTSSCMTCHSRASTDANGGNPQGAGFLNPAPPALCPTGSPCSPNGAPNPSWFWNNPGQPNQTRKTLPTDFVWSIPRQAK